jgi:hypothetical protein
MKEKKMRIMFQPWCREKTGKIWHRALCVRSKVVTAVDREYWGEDGGPDWLLMVCGESIVSYEAKGGLKPSGMSVCKVCQKMSVKECMRKFPRQEDLIAWHSQKELQKRKRRAQKELAEKEEEVRWIGGSP